MATIHCEYTELKDPVTLVGHPKNPNEHNEEQIRLLSKIIDHQGWRNPIVVSKRSNYIVAGHARLKAAINLKLDEVPVDFQDFENEADEYAHLVADNKIAELAEADNELISELISELEAQGLSAELAGFNTEDLESLIKDIGIEETDDDAEVKEELSDQLQEKWGVKEGQLWELGDHKIICGDSTADEVVDKLLGGEIPNLMVTDPPYGVNYDPNWRNELHVPTSGRAIGKVLNDDNADWTEAYKLFEGDIAYVYHAGANSGIFYDSLIKAGFEIRSQIIWNKSQMAFSQCNYHPKHEPCYYAVRKGRKANWQADRKQTTVWDIDKPQRLETGHSTQKPLECMARPIRHNSSPGDLVYDPFSGSGTTIIACENLQRKCRAIELNPGYVAIAIERWHEVTSKEPKLL
jgi:DNA modification methylase